MTIQTSQLFGWVIFLTQNFMFPLFVDGEGLSFSRKIKDPQVDQDEMSENLFGRIGSPYHHPI